MDIRENEPIVLQQCLSCHCRREEADFMTGDDIFNSCNRCRAKRVEYHAAHRDTVRLRRYGNKERKTCPCNPGGKFFAYCEDSHVKTYRHIEWVKKNPVQTEQ